ncbi:hypothetical protein AND_003159 [Anopheles darlingi]|uniref:Intraflagellar transport 20 n=1 Tax=Anopheles darlingi TaxID=43151 RepID=W5JQQ2_ANODA|nr:hypothetical protein AND_003159 [Anopheles darlingi]
MGEEFGKSGLFIDDLYALRVIDPEVANETNELKDECEQFTDSKPKIKRNPNLSSAPTVLIASILQELAEFRRIIDQFANIIETFAVEVDQEKMRAVGVQNMLKTFSKQRESEQQQIQSEIIEKMVELDKLKIEYQYLQRVESEQQEMIDTFYQHQ